MEKLNISIIVLTRNSEATLVRCLEAAVRSGPAEIIVVDGGSTDGTLSIAERYADAIYNDGGNGLCFARQMGAERANAPFIMYVDSDVVLRPGTMEVMLSELRTKGYGSVTARVIMTGARGYGGWALSRYKNIIGPDRPRETKSVPMRASLFPRELVLKHGFDLSMPNADGASIGFRLVQAGYKHAISSATVEHYCPPGRNGRSLYWEGYAIAEFLLKYGKSPRIVVRYTLLGGLCFPLFRMFVSILKGDPRLAPYFGYVFLMELAGFTGKLVGAFSRALMGRKKPRSSDAVPGEEYGKLD